MFEHHVCLRSGDGTIGREGIENKIAQILRRGHRHVDKEVLYSRYVEHLDDFRQFRQSPRLFCF